MMNGGKLSLMRYRSPWRGIVGQPDQGVENPFVFHNLFRLTVRFQNMIICFYGLRPMGAS